MILSSAKLKILVFIIQLSGIAAALVQPLRWDDFDNSDITEGATESLQNPPATPLHQLNCTTNTSICYKVCGERQKLPYSSTFCDSSTGSCVCDCRDAPRKDCVETPFTPCFQDCVKKNPNPDVFLYKGGNCPMSNVNGTIFYQCACRCTYREDYEETNDLF